MVLDTLRKKVHDNVNNIYYLLSRHKETIRKVDKLRLISIIILISMMKNKNIYKIEYPGLIIMSALYI